MFSSKLTVKWQRKLFRQVARCFEQRGFRASVPPSLQEAQTLSATETARPFNEIPGPKSFPIIGTLWSRFPGSPLYGLTWEERVSRLQEMYGNIIREEILPGINLVHLFDPQDFETVHRSIGKYPIRDFLPMYTFYYQKYNEGVQGLGTSQGEEWYRLRSAVQQKTMKPTAVAAYLPEQAEVATDFVERLRELRDDSGVIEDIREELLKYSFESIGVICFNKRFGVLSGHLDKSSDEARFMQSVRDVFSSLLADKNGTSFLYRFIETPNFKKLVRAHKFITEQTRKNALETLTRFQGVNGGENEIDGEHGDLIPYLLTKTQLTEREVMTVISDFFGAGVDTTSHFLGYALYAISKNPEKQAKLIAEIDELLPDHAQPTDAIVSKMSFLRAVTKETLRLIPVSTGIARNMTKDIVLRRFHVPAKSIVIMHNDWTQRQKEYFDRADEFVPERWLRGQNRQEVHPFAAMPFGHGARTCPGKRFAEQEVSLALIKVLQNFTIEYKHTEDLRYENCLLNVPVTPLKFRWVDRK